MVDPSPHFFPGKGPSFFLARNEHHFSNFNKKMKRRGEPLAGAIVKRRRYYKSRPSAVGLVLAARKTPYLLRPTSEPKYFDSFLNGGAIAESTDWTGTELDPATLNTLFAPSEGNDVDNRNGRKVAVHKIAMRGVIACSPEADAADIPSSPATRLILFIDQQTNGAQAQGEQIMAAPGAATTQLTSCTFQNLANLGRFRVLRDITFRPTTVTSGTDGTNTNSNNRAEIPFKMTVKFPTPVIIRFNAVNGGTVADIVDNSFHLIGQKSNSQFVNGLSYQCRTYYRDS